MIFNSVISGAGGGSSSATHSVIVTGYTRRYYGMGQAVVDDNEIHAYTRTTTELAAQFSEGDTIAIETKDFIKSAKTIDGTNVSFMMLSFGGTQFRVAAMPAYDVLVTLEAE